jgi:hypothetical protein
VSAGSDGALYETTWTVEGLLDSSKTAVGAAACGPANVRLNPSDSLRVAGGTRVVKIALASVVCLLLAASLACRKEAPEGDSARAPHEAQGSVSWEPGEYGFDASVVPWPARSGAAVTIRAIAGIDDGDRRFSGDVSFRIQPEGGAAGAWVRMAGTEIGDEGTRFEAEQRLPAGKVGLHFRINDLNLGRVVELTDWTLEVR